VSVARSWVARRSECSDRGSGGPPGWRVAVSSRGDGGGRVGSVAWAADGRRDDRHDLRPDGRSVALSVERWTRIVERPPRAPPLP